MMDRAGRRRRGGGGGGGGMYVLDDDVVERIFLRIRCCATLRCLPAVCKRWRSITDGDPFRYFHQLRSRRHALLGSHRSTWVGEEGRARHLSFTVGEAVESHICATPSCHGLVLLLRRLPDDVRVCNPTTGETLRLPPPGCSFYLDMLALGFHPPTNKYKALIVRSATLHALTLGMHADTPWRTFQVPEAFPVWLRKIPKSLDAWEVEQVPCFFCYNGVLYLFFRDDASVRTNTTSPLVTFDIGSEAFRVHYGRRHDELGISADLSVNHYKHLKSVPIRRGYVEKVILLHNFGQAVDIWRITEDEEENDYGDDDDDDESCSLSRVVSFKIEEEEQDEEEESPASTTITTAVVAPLCIRMESTLICDDEGLRLYHDLMNNLIEDENGIQFQSSFLISLHAGTPAPLQDLII